MSKRTLIPTLVLALLVPGAAAQAADFAAPSFEDMLQSPEALPETLGTPRDIADRNAEMGQLHARLAAVQVRQALDRPLKIELTRAERAKIDQLGSAERRYFVGVAKPIRQQVDFSARRGGTERLGMGVARSSANGFVWTASIRVPGATALRLGLDRVDLPPGASLYVYNQVGQAFGPYTGRGPLGTGVLHTHTVAGEEILLQLASPAGQRAPRFELVSVGVMGARFVAPRFGPRGFHDEANVGSIFANASNLCSRNADCVINAACTSSTAVNGAKDAIASILFQSGASFYICTGGLIADNVSTSVIPYFLTANHCISSGSEAASVETYFDYQTTCSNPNCTQPYNNNGETIGATLKSGSSATDHTLLQLSSAPTTPDGVATYLGWQSTPVANTNNTPLYRISHPAGSPQAYSEQVVDTSKVTCGGLARGNFIYSRDTLGGTEGGSSGSPVVNGSGQIVGQLYGACGFNVNDPCDAAANATVDGAFAAYFNSVSPFLNPGGGGGCSAKGTSCTTGSQCCSGNCKGKPGAMTCK